MASKLTGVKASISYSNSNGTITNRLRTYNVDTAFPEGKDTPLPNRPYIQGLGGVFPENSQIVLTLDIDGSSAVQLSASSTVEIPARRFVKDAIGEEQFTLTLADFIPEFKDGSVTAITLLPGRNKNTFAYTLSQVERILLGQPSESATNMNNSTILMEMMKP